jgi:hypothetical protein
MSMGRRRYASEFMNRELTNSFPERSDSKMGRRSLLGMAAAVLAGRRLRHGSAGTEPFCDIELLRRRFDLQSQAVRLLD